MASALTGHGQHLSRAAPTFSHLRHQAAVALVASLAPLGLEEIPHLSGAPLVNVLGTACIGFPVDGLHGRVARPQIR